MKRISGWATRMSLILMVALVVSAGETQKESSTELEVADRKDERGKIALSQGQFEDAENMFRDALRIRERLAPESRLTAMSWIHLGNTAAAKDDSVAADTAYRRALVVLEKVAPRGELIADALNNLGKAESRLGKLQSAEMLCRRALEIQTELSPSGVRMANVLSNLGGIAISQGHLAEARTYYEKALSIQSTAASISLELASTLNGLGIVAYLEGDLVLAEERYRQSLEIKKSIAPRGLGVAVSLDNLGIVAAARGDLARSDEYHQRSLALSKRVAPASMGVASSLSYLGENARDRGDFALAEDYQRQALEIYMELAPDSPEAVTGLVSLGALAQERADLDQAEHRYRRALSICRKMPCDSFRMAAILNALGIIAMKRDDHDQAFEYYREALELYTRISAKSLQSAAVLDNMGVAAKRRNHLVEAERYHQESLKVLREIAPDGLRMAGSLFNLGTVASRAGDLSRAEKHYLNALAIYERLAPDSISRSQALQSLARISHKKGRLNQAIELFERSILVLERQIEKLGGSYAVESGFRAQYERVYRDMAEAFLEAGQPERAFSVLERFRARTFLAMLAERDLAFTSDIPEELDRERQKVARRYDQIYRQISALTQGKNLHEVETLSDELKRLRFKRGEIEAEIRKTSRRFADLRYPAPLTLYQVQEALDPGTVLLSFSVHKRQTLLFVITRDEGLVRVETLPFSETEIHREVDRFLGAISHASTVDSPFFKPLRESAGRLFEILIGPATDTVDRNERVLIVPDGPLHLLPFGALVGDTGEYLAEWKPLHLVLSATLYAELRRTRRQHGSSDQPGTRLVAFGDPQYPDALRSESTKGIPELRVRSAVERSLFDWEPLPHSRREVEAIAALYPPGSVRTFLGENATEEAVNGVGGQSVDVLHFAVHGHLDDHSPLDSGLALTMPEGFPQGRENGLLQAWEIVERVRIDADLVVLSACQSALGKEVGGEGLIGLVRAFQYAGARTVAATLWNVSDLVTGELMVRFYRHLRSGESKDVALQAAQVELIRGGRIEVENAAGRRVTVEASTPYFWAGSQIIGDWR